LQDWAVDETPSYELSDIVIGGINRDGSQFWKNNALLDRLQERDQANG
jgi:hypothetical protein